MNDADRAQWIENDEGLYLWRRAWCRQNTGRTRGFIRANRAEIDEYIENVTTGSKPAHYGAYGG